MINEKFWLAIAFISFLGLVLRHVWPVIAKNLDQKSKEIAEEILTARELKESAAKLLKEAELYKKESAAYAQKLILDAKIEAEKFLDEAHKAAALEIDKKTNAAYQRIKIEEENAIREIKLSVVNSAMENLYKNIDINKDQHHALLDQATKDFEKTIN